MILFRLLFTLSIIFIVLCHIYELFIIIRFEMDKDIKALYKSLTENINGEVNDYYNILFKVPGKKDFDNQMMETILKYYIGRIDDTKQRDKFYNKCVPILKREILRNLFPHDFIYRRWLLLKSI